MNTSTLTLVFFATLASTVLAGDANEFTNQVQPLLAAKCVSCHGPEKQEGGLRLDSLAAAKKGGDRGPAIVPGDVAKSWLVESVRFTNPDLQMPPKNKLADKEIETLTQWVKSGAEWPEPVVVLFEDEPAFLAALTSGNGRGRLVEDAPFGGRVSLGITPLQRDGVKIPGWNFAIREQPRSGEYRYLRLAWKKRGEGSVMIELASSGQWPDAKVAKGRYFTGKNSTGWAAISVGDVAPSEWKVETFDLWKDIGEFTLTGFAPTCDRGEEAFFDSIVLGPTVASLDAYRPGARPASQTAAVPPKPVGDAFSDKRNPIYKLFGEERLDLWSLKKPTRHAAPQTIDGFVRQRLSDAQLQPSPEADRRTLIRRLTFDLTGLPPTPAEVDAFLADQSPDAYDQLISRLLDSPRYGERQARFWLDVVRYADTNGYERDEFRPLIWQYRDYVIRSFNRDKPFDEFIREQLAGDELQSGPPKTPAEADRLIATGYLRLGQWDSTASIFQEETRLRAEIQADLTNTTAAAFLGLTFSCCQCHDHKYDPLSQADHYRLRAFFAGVTPQDAQVIDTADEQAAIAAHNAPLDKQVAELKEQQKKLESGAKAESDRLAQEIRELESRKRKPKVAMAAADGGDSAPATHILYQGDHGSPREAVEPGFVSVFHPGPATLTKPRPGTTGRRLALANWIASAENPWTARVFVNRVWQQHFGAGLVATANDFGYSGARPTHPELLDWLATEFVREGWSVKKLHRRIVTSATYRQGSNSKSDNRLLSRQNLQRLDAETLRDALLAVSGLLRPYDAGQPLWPAVPDELLKAQPAILEAEKGGDGGRMQGWYTDPVEQTDVRSVFLIRKRALPVPFLQAFDLPDTTVSCARRDTTVVAPQALLLLNSPEGVRFATALADRIETLAGPDATKQIRTLFRESLARSPDDDELRLAADLLDRHAAQHRAGPKPERAAKLALVDLCRAVLNLNEFLYLD